MNKKAFYISYDGALDSLGASQILPYLSGLAESGVSFTLLTYEKRKNLCDSNRVCNLRKSLKEKNIKWEVLVYHKRPSVIATGYDIIVGILKGLAVVLRDRIKVIHARSFVGALPGLILAKLFRIKFIYDMRGFWPDERVDGGLWPKNGILYRCAKRLEETFLYNADHVVCLTQEAKTITKGRSFLKGKKSFNIDLISTCADINKFTIKPKDKLLVEKLGIAGRFVFVYLGSLGTWYMLDEMIDFFKIAKQLKPDSFFLLITPDKSLAQQKIDAKKIKREDYFIEQVFYEETCRWLSLADASISFIKPLYSKKSSCPTKFGESLACGIPVIINSGIGDTERIVSDHKIGVIVRNFSGNEYRQALERLFNESQDKAGLRDRCRKTAENYFSLYSGIEKYGRIYSEMFQ